MAGRIAITGANGFVGRHLTRAASAEGWEVAGVVRSDAAAQVVGDAGGQARVVPDLASPNLADALAGAATLVHLAQVGAERAGESYQETNLEGTRRALAAARRARVPRIVFLSGLGVAHYGIKRRCTNSYFLSKLACELELFRSGLEVVVFRPSYILGPGGELIPSLLEEIARGEVEMIGNGGFRIQPIAVRDVSALILAAARRVGSRPSVFDLVGREPVSYRELVARVAGAARRLGAGGDYRVREILPSEAERRARTTGYRGMLPDELDCLLSDEVSSPRRLEGLLGHPLTPLDDAIRIAAQGGAEGGLGIWV